MKIKLMSVVIAAGFLLAHLSTALYQPSMPSLAQFMQVNDQQVVLTISVFFFGYALGQLFWGSLSDLIGRQRSLIASLLLYVLATSIVISAKQFLTFNIGYALVGFAAAAYTSVGNAIIKDIWGQQHAKRMIARVGIVLAVGPIIGTAIGARLMLHWQWQASFIALLLVALLILVGVLFFLPETHHPNKAINKSHTSVRTAYKLLLTHPKFLCYISILGLVFSGFFCFMATTPFIFKNQLHISMQQYSWIFPIIVSSYAAAPIIASITIHSLGSRRLVNYGVIFSVAGSVLFVLQLLLLPPILWQILIAMMLILFGFSMATTSAKAGAMTILPHNSGTAASLMKFTQTATTVLITALAAMIHANQALMTIAILLLVLSLLSAIILVALAKVSTSAAR